MRRYCYVLLSGSLLFICTGCGFHRQESHVVAEKYVHKYGYVVSKKEFEDRKYPGQMITTLKDGVTISSTYENGILHGATTYTFPHSQIVKTYCLYHQGELIKEITYDCQGIPIQEEAKTAFDRRVITLWYPHGAPLSIEEYLGDQLLDGQYFSISNELEGRIEQGRGERIVRSVDGTLHGREVFDMGYPYKKETFHSNGIPSTEAHCLKGVLHGEKKTFNENGEPLSVEEYVHGKLHGKSCFYKNGLLSVEVHYLDGLKNGLEVHYFDNGQNISQEIFWENGKKHGLSKYFVGEAVETEYFYEGKVVSRERWNELSKLDHIVNQISLDAAL